MKSIWKFPLGIEDEISVEMPLGSWVLSVGLDPHGVLCAWALVETNAKRVWRTFCIFGTGHPFPDEDDRLNFLGTVVMGRGVWHIFVKSGFQVDIPEWRA